ncbi:VPA1262 family N-terminal domain-containing protein [Flavobacterium sp. 245]|uniref:VPA1262 family N-terminal domain-containing protein n=1 Tax=Flavobacterium sp. 245 TaxID=2512115 RepID=UPI00105E00B3|nr:VPA1262 family N-terminal domain-containing protein [Flavobacterium sp. 245]TDO96073.1 hypothetical protein EV145_11246 [Flavobacterium sp. 245]
MSHLKDISLEYESAEITSIFLFNRKTKKKTNLLTVFELVPTEQQPSLMIGDKSNYYMKREAVDDIYTVHITRLIALPVEEAIAKYEKIEEGLNLHYDTLNVDIEIPFLLEQEPPNYFNVLIDSKDEKTLGRILPKRNTCLRVWSKLNTDKEWLQSYDKKLLEKLTKISTGYLGYDLSAIAEHIGNVYLCAANPFLRKWDSSLVDKEKELLISFHERTGKSIIGCTIVLEEERSKNIGFTITKTITDTDQRIALPYFPDGLNKRIYDPSGQLIEKFYGKWCNIQINMSIQESIVNLNVETEKGIEVYSVPKTSRVSKSTIGKFDLSTARYLRNALNSRRFEELESNKEFIFFPNLETSKAKAQSTVRELLNKANERCIILDPYFGPSDLPYAFTIENISIPVRIISSAVVLKMRVETILPAKKNRFQKFCLFFTKSSIETKNVKTNAELLNENIENFKTAYRSQKIECKVLKGKKSPLHDRYIVIDDDVYLLGSSLNEFGSRATTIIKVPTPIKMIEQAEEWWADKNCPYLKDFIIKGED